LATHFLSNGSANSPSGHEVRHTLDELMAKYPKLQVGTQARFVGSAKELSD